MEFWTTKQAAELLQTSEDTVLRLIYTGIIQSERVSPRGRHRIRRETLEAYAQKQGITLKEPQSK